MGISVIGGSAAGGGSSSTNFYVTVTDNGNNFGDLGKDFPAGDYRVVTANQDNTLDVYLLTSAGAFAGYTSGKGITASQNFSQVFVLGGESGDLITFELATVITADLDTSATGAAPFITSSPSALDGVAGTLPNIDSSVTVTGGNFSAATQAFFVDSSGTELAAKSVSVISDSSLEITRPDVFPGDYYTIKVSAPGVPLPTATGTHLSANPVAPGLLPTWSTAAILPSIANGDAYSTTLVATDPDGQTPLSYAVTSGSLPTGLALNSSTGVISGTPSGLPSSPTAGISFTVTASDSAGMSISREFTLPILLLQTFTASGLFTVPSGVESVNYEVLSGGGGTASFNSSSYYLGCGGGGGGGLVTGSQVVSAGDIITVTVGAGGAGLSGDPNGRGGQGGASSLSVDGATVVSVVGGGGGGCWSSGGDGACGGGIRNGTVGIGSIGYNGGKSDQQNGAGGGGGMSSIGQDGNGSNGAGTGGNGLYMIDGSAVAGGGGGQSANGAQGIGSFGGGNGKVNGAANTGGGGGGIQITSNQPTGKNGGSGKIILYYEVV